MSTDPCMDMHTQNAKVNGCKLLSHTTRLGFFMQQGFEVSVVSAGSPECRNLPFKDWRGEADVADVELTGLLP